MRFHSVRNKMMVSTFLLILICALVVIYICSQQMETHFFQYLQDPSALAGQGGQAAGGYGRGMGRGMMGGGMGMGGMHHRMMLGAAERTFVESYHKSLWWIGFLFAGMGLVVSYFLSGNITRPLRQLSQAAEKIRQGHLKQEVPVETQDEVGQLAAVFNQMSAELAANESNRQEFLANIAHELKTPLAVLRASGKHAGRSGRTGAGEIVFHAGRSHAADSAGGGSPGSFPGPGASIGTPSPAGGLEKKAERGGLLEPLLEEKRLPFRQKYGTFSSRCGSWTRTG